MYPRQQSDPRHWDTKPQRILFRSPYVDICADLFNGIPQAPPILDFKNEGLNNFGSYIYG